MSIGALLGVGIVATILLLGAGYKLKALKFVVIALLFFWAVGIDIFVSEIKPKGYDEIAKMKGKCHDTDQLIQEAGETISLYEFLAIKRSFLKNENKH